MGIGRQRAVSATGSTDRKRYREVEGYGGESDLVRRIEFGLGHSEFQCLGNNHESCMIAGYTSMKLREKA